MSELSIAAKAVMAAFDKTYESDKCAIANALRAVVEHCVPDDSEGHWVYIPHVLAIADELEGVKYGTYRCDLKEK